MPHDYEEYDIFGHKPQKKPGSTTKKRANKTVSRPLWKTLLIHVFLFVVAFGLAGISFLMLMDKIVMPIYQKTGLEVRTPDLRGKTVDDARGLAAQFNLSVVIDTLRYSTEFPSNTVMSQYPLEGSLVKPMRRIHLDVSQGSRPIEMPDVVGLSRRDAELRVKDAGLGVSATPWVRSNSFKRYVVAGQNPPAGEFVGEDTEVTLYISNGEPEINVVMPNLIDLSLSAARDTLRTTGFDLNRLGVNYVDEENMLPETVIDQYPSPGTSTYKSIDVTIDVSRPQ